MTKKSTNFMKELSWTEFKERSKTTDFVIIPTGAFEVYGEHLPLGTDTIVAEKIAELIAERLNAVIGPTLEVGDSKALEKLDRKSTRLNSSHVAISYAVFCLKKKKQK